MPQTTSQTNNPTNTQTIGILGGGQLGQMLAGAAAPMGLRTIIFEPSQHACAAPFANQHICAEYSNQTALKKFANACDIITLEFENVPTSALTYLASLGKPVHPSAHALGICQHRQREKEWLKEHAFPCAPFAVAKNIEELAAAVAEVGAPCIVKSAAFGYDGKGQARIETATPEAIASAWERVGAHSKSAGENPGVVVEGFVHFTAEYSVIIARGQSGHSVHLPLTRNKHIGGILSESICPSGLSAEQEEGAVHLASNIASTLGIVGLLCIELFLRPCGTWVVNELAPRPHNSGHGSIEGCTHSQFTLHLQAITGQTLVQPTLKPGISTYTMQNILGKHWPVNEATLPHGSTLHLYGKQINGSPPPGRKLAHVTKVA